MSGRGWALFALVSVAWGMPYLFVKVALNEGVEPATLTFARVAIAAAILLPLALARRAVRTVRNRRASVAAVALLDIALPLTLVSVAEQHVSSALGGILVASTPVLVAVLAMRFDDTERVAGARAVGVAVGLAGVALLVGDGARESLAVTWGVVAFLVAALCYAAATLVVKRVLTDVPSLGVSACSLSAGAVLLLPAAIADGAPRDVSGAGVAAVVVLGVVCTALGFLSFYALVAEAGASRAALVTYAAPAVAVALGVTFLDETLSATAVAGLVLVLAGSYLAAGHLTRRMPRVPVVR